MNEKSGFISLANRELYATAFLPDSHTAQMAVLIIDPVGEEKRAAYRMLVRLARKLAGMNVAAMKFDLSGTGDSSLPHREATFETWLQDASAAATELREIALTDNLSIVAARAGALVAAAVAKDIAANKVVLAEPVISGKDFMTDLQRRQNIKNMMSGIKDENSPEKLWEQNMPAEFGGYDFSKALAEGIAHVSLDSLLPELTATTVHAIRVSPSTKLPPAWNVFNGNTEIVADKPFWGQLDYYESDIVIDAIVKALVLD